MPEILLATRNPGKLREIRQIGALHSWTWHGLDEFPHVPDAPEDADTFEENARRKALHYAAATSLLTLADDSGLEVDALGGEPGVRSARYAGEPRDDRRNNARLVAALAGKPWQQRTARFRCAMALARPGQVLLETQGVIEGMILDEPRGSSGFGYDPHFYVPSLGRTLAELPAHQKNAVSHRGRALREMLEQMETLFGQPKAEPPQSWGGRTGP